VAQKRDACGATRAHRLSAPTVSNHQPFTSPSRVLDVPTACPEAAATPLTQKLTWRSVFLIKFQQFLP
jgi:hypothetical protein